MEGSVQYAEGRILVTAQLIDPETNAHLWSDNYDREFADIFAIQADIAMNIANALEAEFSLEEQASIEKVPTDSAEAYESFLRAAQAGIGPSGVQLRLAYLDQAIDADPEFALALAYRSFFRSQSLTQDIGTQENYATRRAQLEILALDDIDRALSLDPTLGLAYGARAFIHSRNWRGKDALEAFERAIQLTPYDPVLAYVYILFLSNIGQHEDAIRVAQRFLELDPNNADSHGNLGRALLRAGDFEGANAAHREALRINPNFYNIHWRLCLGLILSGDQAEAEAQLRLLEIGVYSANPVLITNVAYGFSRLGLQDDATGVLNRFEEVVAGRRMPALAWMNVSLARGEEGQALEWLRQAAEAKVPYEGYQLTLDHRINFFQEPVLDRPEFVALREQLGYTDL
jgi:tetratricopeptide (TPR) repeat protein